MFLAKEKSTYLKFQTEQLANFFLKKSKDRTLWSSI